MSAIYLIPFRVKKIKKIVNIVKKWDDKFCAKTGKVSAVNSINQKHVYRRDKTIAVIQVSDWFMRQSLVGLLLGQVIIHNIWYLFIAR